MKSIALRLSLVAGVMDAATGVLLVAAPVTALHLAGVDLPGGDGAAILMRWIGVFVGGVGSSYLWALAARDGVVRHQRLAGVWGATAIIRTGVALFCFAAVAAGALAPVWLVVGCTDVLLAGLQIAGMRAGWIEP